MKPYKVKINKNALLDIQESTIWYNEQFPKLGSRFQKVVKQHVENLKYNAGSYSIRYADVRCMLIKKFPFLIHFRIDETKKIIEIFAIIHTSRNPKIWKQKTKKG